MEDVKLVQCGKCESEAFTEIIMFAEVSAVMSQTGQAGIAPVGKTFICMNCGTPIEESEAVKKLSEKSEIVLAK